MDEKATKKVNRTYRFAFEELKRKLAEHNITLREISDTINVDEKLISALFDDDIINVINKLLITFEVPIRTYKKTFRKYDIIKRGVNYFVRRNVAPLSYIHFSLATSEFSRFHIRTNRKAKKISVSRIEKQLILNEMRDALKEYFKNNPPDTHFV
jgi:hypothetical protein